MGRRAGWLLVTAFLLLAGPEAARAASFPPELRFRSISTDRVTVHFHQGLEEMARRAASLATEILQRHEARYGVHVGRVNLVLADVEDDPNGFASPLPYPLVQLRAVAPDGSEDFGNYDGGSACATEYAPHARRSGRLAADPTCWAAPLSSSRTPSLPPG
jgi:hypothetical protein